jgi:radical SAM superfamily enzyme YgiQ (UPF0313 family)
MKVAFWRAVGKDVRLAKVPSLAERCLQEYAQRTVPFAVEWQHCATSDELIRSGAHVAAVSSVTDTWPQAQAAMEAAKQAGKTVVVGGPHVTAAPGSPCAADCQVIGEGESAFSRTLQLIADGVILPNTLAAEPIDLLETPWLPMGVSTGNKKMLAVFSRGCPYRCTFCSASKAWGAVRHFSPQAIGNWCCEHMEDGYGLSLLDLIFAHDLSWLREAVHHLKLAGAGSRWILRNLASRTNLITDELHRVLIDVDLKCMSVGMESGSQPILSKLKPACTIEDHERAIQLAYKYGVELHATFVIGTPGETDKDLQRTCDFIEQWQGKYFVRAGLYILTPYPGTVWWDYANEHNLLGEPPDWSMLHCDVGGVDWSWNDSLYLNEETMPRERLREWYQRLVEVCRQRDPDNIRPSGLRAQ